MAILKKRFKFTDSECDEYEVNIWERDNDEKYYGKEDFYVSIENIERMDVVYLRSIADIQKAIDNLQKAIDFIVSKGVTKWDKNISVTSRRKNY